MRQGVIGALTSANLLVGTKVVTIDSPGDWNFDDTQLPAIVVRTGRDSKVSKNVGQVDFLTSTEVLVKVSLMATTAEAAQQQMEALWYQIENAICWNYGILGTINQIASIDTQLDISAHESRGHIAGMAASFRFEAPEVYSMTDVAPVNTTWPIAQPVLVPLQEIFLDADLTNVFDPNGTYVSPIATPLVTPAPRTAGLDGRPEGGGIINLP